MRFMSISFATDCRFRLAHEVMQVYTGKADEECLLFKNCLFFSVGQRRCGTIQYARRISTLPAKQDFRAESFEIDGFFYVMVVSHHDGNSRGIDSIIYRFDGDTLTRYQSVQTDGATDAIYFEMEGERYLAVAQMYGDRTSLKHRVKSQIYKWNGSQFIRFQALPTAGATTVEYFIIGGYCFLAFANSYNTSISIANSQVYKWTSDLFVLFQSIPTSSAHGIIHIEIADSHFLAIANHNSRSTYNIDSMIYRWSGAQFEIFQSIPTQGAHDVETFSLGQFTFIGFANYYNSATKSSNTDSTFYIWNGNEFEEFQSIPTRGATDLQVFKACDRQYVAVSNRQDGGKTDIPSVIYEVAGSGLRPYQTVTVPQIQRWSTFQYGNDTYLFGGPNSHTKKSYMFKWVG